jgi:SPP1 gp7 family putative phage head morphogenesis protein
MVREFVRSMSLTFRGRTMDAKTIKGKFKPSVSAEQRFQKALKEVARHAGHIVNTHVDGPNLRDQEAMTRALNDYAKRLEPWARRQSAKMLQTVQRSNSRAYKAKSKAMGLALEFGEAEREVLMAAQLLMHEQVTLITSIPLEAGLRAQGLALNNVTGGLRAAPDDKTVAEIEKQLGLSTEVAQNRAQLIAITETARANASFNQVRAQRAGSRQYRWHNSGDAAVRHSHKIYQGKRLQGMIFSWGSPPTLDDGMTGHPGTFPRCRCFAEPVFDDE